MTGDIFLLCQKCNSNELFVTCNILCHLQVNDDQLSNNAHSLNGVLTSKSTNPKSNNKKGTTGTCVASTMTDPELLGPCQPGTAVKLQGAVLQECHGKLIVTFHFT